MITLWAQAMLLGLVFEILLPTEAADLRSKAAREAAEYVLKKFGKEVAEESAESLARKIEVYTAKHGEEFLEAVRKVGPRAFHLAEEAGVHGNQAVKLMARFGDDATVWVLSRPKAAAMFAKYGEDAAEALIKHKGIAEPVVEAFGRPAISALKTVNAQNGRRLAMMLEEGELAAMGRSPELLDVVAKHGDRAMEFIWRHKGALVVSAGLTAFLANPQPFLDGTKDLTKIAAEAAVKPVAEVPGKVAQEAARGTNWTLVAIVALFLVTAYAGLKLYLRRRAIPRGDRGQDASA